MFVFDLTVAADHGIPISIIDQTGSRCLVGEHFATVMQRPHDELVGVPWYTITHADDVDPGRDMMQQILANDAPLSLKRRLIRGNGAVIEAVLHGRRLPHPNGRGYVIQTNMSVAAASSGSSVKGQGSFAASTDPQLLLAIIRANAAALSTAAGTHDLRLLQHLLAMASAEARSELERALQRSAALAARVQGRALKAVKRSN